MELASSESNWQQGIAEGRRFIRVIDMQVRRRRTLDAIKRIPSHESLNQQLISVMNRLLTNYYSCEPKSGLVIIRVETISHSRTATNRAGVRPKCHGVCAAGSQRIRDRSERNCRTTGTLLAQRSGEGARGEGQGGPRLPGYKKGGLHRRCAIWL